MVEVNLTIKEFTEKLTCDEEHGYREIDNYRRILDYDKDNFMALYYTDYIDLDNLDEISVYTQLKFLKDSWDSINKKNYGKTTLERRRELVSAIEKVQDEYVSLVGNDSTKVISGIVVCAGYPVGVLLPKTLTNYISLHNLEESGIEMSRDDLDDIFDGAKWWVDKLMEHDVYVDRPFVGNIYVSPNNYNHVVLDKLDEIGTCRMETKEYAQTLAKKGNNLKASAYRHLQELKDKCQNDYCSNQHFI